MKKNFFLLILLQTILLQAPAQSIGSYLFDPVNPTAADTVRVYVECNFTSGGCGGVAYLNGVNGNVINATAVHCMGSLTVMCTDYDTLVIPPLQAGSYTLIFELRTGVSISCTPNIIPVVIDSTHFVVSPVTQVSSAMMDKFLLIPNPLTADAEARLESPDHHPAARLSILDAWGRKVFTDKFTGQRILLKRNSFTAGFYFYFLSEGEQLLSSGKLVVQ